MDMALSIVWVSMSMSMFLMLHGTFLIVLEPLRLNKWILIMRKTVFSSNP